MVRVADGVIRPQGLDVVRSGRYGAKGGSRAAGWDRRRPTRWAVSEPVAGYAGPGVAAEAASPDHAPRAASVDPAAARNDAGIGAATDAAENDVDELLLLGERCAATYMRADALQYEAMVLLAEFDERDGWLHTAHTSTADWLAWRIGITAGAARERVRTARALRELPQTSAAMRGGELSYAKARALTRVARPASEAALLEFARSCSAARLERKLRSWTSESRESEARSEERRHASRRFSVFPDEDGMYAVRGRLDPEVGAALMRAIEAASDALYLRERRAREIDGDGEVRRGRDGSRSRDWGDRPDDVTPDQWRADAVGLLAERALAAGFADGPVSGSRAERYQVVLHVEPAALRDVSAEAWDRCDVSGDVSAETRGTSIPARDVSAETRGTSISARDVSAGTRDASIPARDVSAETRNLPVDAGPRPLSRLADGTRLAAETARRLACDASVVVVARASDASGSRGDVRVLDVGRRTRTIPPALRRALDVRDGGCRYPGCGSRFADGHHIEHWADGGETRLENLVLLCRRHHRAVHEGRARACRGADDSVAFFRRDGRVLYDAPPRSLAARNGTAAPNGTAALNGTVTPTLTHSGVDEPVRPVREDELRLDLPSHRTGAARWARDRDVPFGIEVRALEALERAADWR